jgi:hypothetical protein
MPCNYKLYPKNWLKEIRPAILNRANNCCEICGVKNKTHGYRDKSGKFYSAKEIFDLLENEGYDIFCNELSNVLGDAKPIKIVLAIAHLDHNIENNKHSNLKAMCQFHNLEHNKKNSRETLIKKKKLQSLF